MRYFFYIFVTFFLFFNIEGIGLAIAQTGTSTTGTSNTGTSNTGASNTGTSTTPVTTPSILPANPDEISDTQLRDFIQKAKASGMSDDQIRQAAIAKGMSVEDVNKLQKRINVIRTPKDVNSNEPITKKDEFGRDVIDDEAKKDDNNKKKDGKGKKDTTSVKIYPRDGSVVYGSELFNNSNLTFEPNLRIPTPQNYRLGPDDQILVNIYGNSIADWKLPVSPEGNISLPGIGLLNVSGKTMEQATGLITSKLIANHYAIGHGTNVAVSIGNIRSIKVIMIGEIVKPGTITLSSLSTVFAALYLSGGPNSIGSFRQIQVIRNGDVIRTLDVYDFLLRGSQKDNIRLQEGDMIRVPTYKVRVRLAGQVKRPATYEVLPGETLQDVIGFAGGFTDIAYTASIKATQLTDQDKKVTDIKAGDFNNYIPLRGDYYNVDQILDTYENRVSIFGAVIRPGQFELNKGLTLTQLVTKAAGLRQDAFTQRDFISRLKADNTQEIIAFDIKAILNKTAPDIQLKKEDVVTIPSIFDLRDEYTVSINGEVRGGGSFPYSDKMSVEDLIVQAGGFVEGASPSRIEVARRVYNSDPNQKNSPGAQVFQINVDNQFKLNASSFILQPFDVVSVYSLPGYEKQKTVKIEGEVLYPGNYTITNKDEKISDLVKRAGGLTASADVDGGRLKRIDKLGINAEKSKSDMNEINQERTERLIHIQKTLKDSSNNVFEQLKNDYVGIDLKAILSKPGSNIDLLLEEGDVLRIPKQQQLVKVNGEVLFPSSIVYDSSKSLPSFVNSAGGFSPNALRKRAYVVYANGSVKATHHFLFIKSYPQIKPGSEIVIPKKQEHKGISAAEVGGIAGALASAAAVLIGVITLTR